MVQLVIPDVKRREAIMDWCVETNSRGRPPSTNPQGSQLQQLCEQLHESLLSALEVHLTRGWSDALTHLIINASLRNKSDGIQSNNVEEMEMGVEFRDTTIEPIKKNGGFDSRAFTIEAR